MFQCTTYSAPCIFSHWQTLESTAKSGQMKLLSLFRNKNTLPNLKSRRWNTADFTNCKPSLHIVPIWITTTTAIKMITSLRSSNVQMIRRRSLSSVHLSEVWRFIRCSLSIFSLNCRIPQLWTNFLNNCLTFQCSTKPEYNNCPQRSNHHSSQCRK